MADLAAGLTFPLGGDLTSDQSVGRTTGNLDLRGMDIALQNNPANGRFGFVIGDDGDIALDNTGAHAVMTAAMEHLGGYWANRRHGSRIYLLKSATSRTPSQAAAMITQAEQDLVTKQIVTNVQVDSALQKQTSGLNSLVNQISWTIPSGSQQTVTL